MSLSGVFARIVALIGAAALLWRRLQGVPHEPAWGSAPVVPAANTLAADLAEQVTGFQDFVVAHELLHLRVPNHGRLFKALMTAYVPGWRLHDVRR